jgi:hypothetical protein
MDQDDLFVALHVIGELKPKDKLAVYANYVTIHPSSTFVQRWLTRLKRTFYFETKNKRVSYKFIKSCMAALEVHLTNLLDKKDKLTLGRLVVYLEKAILGLANLKETYEEDVNMVGQLKVQMTNIQLLVDKIHVALQKKE